MTTKHTPGPWQYHPLGNIYFVPQKQFTIICNAGINETVGCVIDEKNASLIAAAPELLAALESLVKAGEAQFGESGWPAFFHNGALTNARAAIAKAKGE